MARVTFSTMYDTTMRYIQRNASDLNKQYEKIASEQMINRPSDDPTGFSSTMKYTNIINSLGQYQLNMDDAEVYMTVLESSHQSMNNVYMRCRELAVQAASDTQNHQQRIFTNMEVRENLEQLVSISQTQHKDGYIFSGKWTNQPPYEIKNGEAKFNDTDMPAELNTPIQLYDNAYIDNNIRPIPDNPMVQRVIPGSVQISGLYEKGHAPEGVEPDYEIDYVNGTITLLSDRAVEAFNSTEPPAMEFEYIYRNSIDMSGEIYREIDTSVTVKINSNPDDLFGKGGENDTDCFKEIIALMQGLWYNDQPEINKSIESIDNASKRNLAEQAVTGSKLNRIELTRERNDDLNIANHDAKTRIQGVDLAEAYTQLTLSQAVYDASLQVASRLMQKSLLDYL